jgi:Icc-related predicted phosphoesterase
MSGSVRRVLAVADPRGDAAKLEQVVKEVDRNHADAIALVGGLTGDGDKREAYRAVFKTLGKARVQSFWVPGADDAPIAGYLRESYNIEMVFPFLHGIHGTIALSPDYLLFAGMGGDISDDPDLEREERDALRYPGWEVEYRLKILRELSHEYQKVFMFSAIPAHKGLDEPGSEVLAELIKTHRPRVALIAGGEGVRKELLAKTLVVFPGSLARNEYAVVNVRERTVEPVKLSGRAA